MSIKYYVITLERSPERKQSVIRNFKKAGITNYEFIAGLDALQYRTAQLHRFLDKKNLVRPLPNGMIGCCIGHVKAVRRFLKDDSNELGVIMEDDFLIHADLPSLLSRIDQSILNDGPVLLYGYVIKPIKFEKLREIDHEHTLYEVEHPLHIWSAMGYMLNKKTAETLIKAQYPVRDVSDSWSSFFDYGGFKKLFIFYPFLISHEVFDSSREKRKQAVADWVIQKKVPVLYQLLKHRRKKFIESHTNLISFSEKPIVKEYKA